ncbi:MAG: anti-sigma factor [Hyphomicrobiales bacterium]|nr:anti-sigma factor [Hyphomicrobiales bacterium]
MTLLPEDDLDAAEAALGALPADEAAAAAARAAREPAFAAAVARWEGLLAPLNEATAPVTPDRDTWPAIAARIDPPAAGGRPAGAQGQGAQFIDLSRRLSRWRGAAVGLGALAASMAVGVVVREKTRPVGDAGEYVAVLQTGGAASPAFVVSVDLTTRRLLIRPVAAKAPEGKAYELWIIDPRLGPPKSLGVVGASGVTSSDLKPYGEAAVADATYAITVEKPGGSGGTPSGPPVFAAKLIPFDK